MTPDRKTGKAEPIYCLDHSEAKQLAEDVKREEIAKEARKRKAQKKINDEAKKKRAKEDAKEGRRLKLVNIYACSYRDLKRAADEVKRLRSEMAGVFAKVRNVYFTTIAKDQRNFVGPACQQVLLSRPDFEALVEAKVEGVNAGDNRILRYQEVTPKGDEESKSNEQAVHLSWAYRGTDGGTHSPIDVPSFNLDELRELDMTQKQLLPGLDTSESAQVKYRFKDGRRKDILIHIRYV